MIEIIGEKKTNADVIREMSVEGLAKLFYSGCPDKKSVGADVALSAPKNDCNKCNRGECNKCLLDWLRQEARG